MKKSNFQTKVVLKKSDNVPINLFCEKSKENLTKSIPFIKLVINSILFVHGCHFGWRPLDIISKFFLHKHRNQNPF